MPRNLLMMDVLDSVLDALLRAVVVRGDLAPSLRTLAADAGMSPAALVHHCQSRTHAMQLAAARWTQDRADSFWRCRSSRDLVSLLPRQPQEVSDAAFEFALEAMGRGHEGIARSMSELRRTRRQHLADAFPGLQEAELDLVLAAIEGLRLATTLPHVALDCQAAQEALARLVGLMQDRLTSAS